MIRRLRLALPSAAQSADGRGATRPLRILAVSDQADEALTLEVNRAALRPIDAIIGAGDLEPEYLALLADAFCAPLLYVLGNHDRGQTWRAASERHLPEPMADARVQHLDGVDVFALSWPGRQTGRPEHDERAAWRQVLRFGLHRSSKRPLIVVSHVPPEGAGDDPSDPFHRGFGAYRWLARRVKPDLWLHGHTTVATQAGRMVISLGNTRLLNVTGGVLIELDSGPAANPSAGA